MKVVLAFDKFKGSATARELNDAAREALSGIDELDVTCVPVADGGDGTTGVLAESANGGQWVTIQAPAPLIQLNPVDAAYFLCDDGTALIEVAAASGLAQVPADLRNPCKMNTLGTGLLMLDAMERGSRHIVLAMGGSATCDAGMGIMCALGAEFISREGRLLLPGGIALQDIDHIETAGISQMVRDCRFTLLADVDNPLCGERGTAAVFGPQKGASPEQVILLEHGMRRVSDIVGRDIACKPGCGAAGGIPSLMMHLLDCELLPGAPYVFARNGMNEALNQADIVITGEGQLDRQTLMGKGPGCVLKMAQAQGIPVGTVCGIIAPDIIPTAVGFCDAVAVSEDLPLEDAMDHDATLVRVSAAVCNLVKKQMTTTV